VQTLPGLAGFCSPKGSATRCLFLPGPGVKRTRAIKTLGTERERLTPGSGRNNAEAGKPWERLPAFFRVLKNMLTYL
jgi:hypothetical protein